MKVLNMESLSHIAHAAYHDLLRLLQDDAVSEIRGTPSKVNRGNKAYWYDSYRVGNTVHKTYIGEDTPALRARMERLIDLKAETTSRRAARARLIRILRAEGMMDMDRATGSLLNAMAKAGVFRLGGTVIGTHAFRLYEGILGLRYSFNQMAQTDDLDIASFERLSLALDDTVSPPLQKVLRDFTFDPVPGLDKGTTWRWKQSRSGLLVEFLTPSFEEAEGIRPLPALGVQAQSLHHLNYLLAEPIKAAALYQSGVLVQIPRPERFAIHKLIVAARRRDDDHLKSNKDRAQAAFLIEALAEDRPDDLREAYASARSLGPRWRERLNQSLKRMPKTAEKLGAL